MLDLVVSGRFALPGGVIAEGEIGVADGRIAVLAGSGELTGAERIDVSAERLILPGHVDAHVHTGSAPGEGVERATRSAAAGGVTTIIDMPYDDPEPVNTLARFEQKVAHVESEAVVDVALYATVAPSGGLGEIAPLHAAGAAAFKVSTFETHPVRFPRVPDGELLLAMEICAGLGALVCFHPENDDIVRRLSERLAARGPQRPDGARRLAPAGRGDRGDRARARVGARDGLQDPPLPRLGRARLRARRPRAERRRRCDGRDLHALPRDGRGRPPPARRARQDQPAAAPARPAGRALAPTRRGPHRPGDLRPRRLGARVKDVPDIFAARSGVPGSRDDAAAALQRGRRPPRLPLGTLLHVLSEGPASRYGLAPQKGAIALGADADLVIFAPGERWRIDEREPSAMRAEPVPWA